MRYYSDDGFFDLTASFSCNALVVSTHTFINKDKRGKGAGQKQHLARLKQAKDMGYNAIICTVQARNTVQKHILSKNGWMMTFTFFNKQSELDIEIWCRNL